MLKIAVVESDKRQAEQLLSHLNNLQKQLSFPLGIKHFESSIKFTDAEKEAFDIAFINPEMPLLSGIELAKRLKKEGSACVIVLCAQTDKYALEGYGVNAAGYLIKPFDFDKFSKTAKNAINIANGRKRVHKLIIDTRQEYRVVATSDIIFIEVEKHDLWVHISGGKKYKMSGTLKQIEEKLKGQPFCRCNNCYLINLDRVELIKDDKVFIEGHELIVSRPRKTTLKNMLSNHVN